VIIAKITIQVLGAQPHFSTTQQLFSSSSDPKQQIGTYFEINFCQKQTHVFQQTWEALKVTPVKNSKTPFTGAAEGTSTQLVLSANGSVMGRSCEACSST